jgi:hypothetical protein
MHHGYHILFFRFDEGNDPPVYSYLENSEKPEETTITQTYLHFSEFLDAIIDESITNSRSRLKLAEEAIKASPGQKISIEELNRNINKQP